MAGAPQQLVHRRGAINSTSTQRRVGKLPQNCTARGPTTGRLSVNLAQKILWHRHHHLRHNNKYTVVYGSPPAFLLATKSTIWIAGNQLGHTDGGALVRRLYGHPSERLARERIKGQLRANLRSLFRSQTRSRGNHDAAS